MFSDARSRRRSRGAWVIRDRRSAGLAGASENAGIQRALQPSTASVLAVASRPPTLDTDVTAPRRRSTERCIE
jgi:hypothetical protein